MEKMEKYKSNKRVQEYILFLAREMTLTEWLSDGACQRQYIQKIYTHLFDDKHTAAVDAVAI